jgi:hypothetical protein
MSKVHGNEQESKTGIERDLRALGARSRRNLTPLDHFIEGLPERSPGRPWEEIPMAFLGWFKGRPGVAVPAVVALVAVALLVIPVSYQHTVGQKVTLEIAGANLDRSTLDGIAQQLKGALDAGAIRLEARAGDGATTYALSTTVPAGAEASAKAVTHAFVQTLEAKGYTARASVDPVREKTSGNVYAMMLDNAIRVSVDGKSAEEIEAEITQALAAAGIPDAQVSVTMDSPDQMKVRIEAQCDGSTSPTVQPVDVELTSDGEPLGGDLHRAEIRMRRTQDDAGEHLILDVTEADKSATVTVDDPGSLSDSDLAGRISKALADQGFTDLSVSVQNGQVQVFCASAPAGAAPTATEPSSWGKLKKQYTKDN